ncbi:hypothetical protein CcaverHIS002_0605500 [Cutaneotrichosporon cavernicola]|uniref:DNA polymerase alpha subunit B n=1 Tax=Cutaneotrichosporon cavernicola TaxID=279322 RepID=A0AA48QY49_9TREE|nr:uncharacterized protein CcaverHIS019_0604950 [Cutaneotrichosporon cavernicola]BEI86263.1 hypothetical protein CcaverHIS002_0605500 [Cutaneotrichosporon cavernicola]BEI94036.1 hypothetical protein CcaverHIS019_0604950 [Cutaneotrichosporon cavernicola]BEJ01815.1 hypothetical protein CcaverHIS631_0604970 [Cutaneotrichosporon cavernicola]BEJ09581.1 hypothetical protein CcaverHIS641_0604960 [Cutaneotrichosporon cavernicola]
MSDDDLRSAFPAASDPTILAELRSMAQIYSLSAQDLFYKHEAFLLSRPSGLRAKLSTFTLDVARELRKEIQREFSAKRVAATPDKVGVRKRPISSDIGGFLDNLTPQRPGRQRLSNAGNLVNIPSPHNAYATPSRTPTAAANSSAYRPTKLGVTPGRAAPTSPISGGETPGDLKPVSQPFRSRPQPLQLLETLNPHLTPSDGAPPGSRQRVKITHTADPKDWDYRYMFEKISVRSEALDEQIDEFAEVIKDAYALADLGDPHLPSEDDIYVVGRILSPPTDTSKASSTALYLQSSRVLGGGHVVPLRFAPAGELKVRGGAPGVRGFGLFPGALVCVKGRNGGGNAFVVNEVLQPPPIDPVMTQRDELLNHQQGEALGGLPISVHVVAGPYSVDSDLLYEPLDALIDVACYERPDVLVMLGPFVDAAHPLIQAGQLSVSPVELFREQVAARLARLHDASPATSVVLVPSVRDLISKHAAYPQAMLDREGGLGLLKKVRLLPNPGTFNINEVQIAVASPDILFHMRREEVFQRAEEAEPDPATPANPNPQGDPLANLVRHVLGHRHFYPLFPPPEKDAAEVNLDVTHWHQLRMEKAPDVLVLPSRLKHFAKTVDGTLAINPGHLSRMNAPGTFAKIAIHPSDAKALEVDAEMDDDHLTHDVFDRARTEVWRI